MEPFFSGVWKFSEVGAKKILVDFKINDGIELKNENIKTNGNARFRFQPYSATKM